MTGLGQAVIVVVTEFSVEGITARAFGELVRMGFEGRLRRRGVHFESVKASRKQARIQKNGGRS